MLLNSNIEFNVNAPNNMFGVFFVLLERIYDPRGRPTAMIQIVGYAVLVL